MDQEKAKAIRDSLIEYAKDNGLWIEVNEARKPTLKDIVVTISIKVLDRP